MVKPVTFGQPKEVTPTRVADPSPTVIQPMVASVSPTTTAIVPHVTPVQSVRPAKPLSLQEVSAFGRSSTDAMGRVSDEILKVARNGDMDVIGKSLGDLLVGAQKYDPKNLGKVGFLQFGKMTFQRIRNNFDTVHSSVEQLTAKVQGQVAHFRKRIVDLEALFNASKKYYDQLDGDIEVLKQRIAEEEANPPVVDPADPFSAQEYAKWQSMIAFAHKRVDDLGRQKLLAQQQAQQITIMAINSAGLVQRFENVIDFTIPNLKTAFNLAIQNMEQQKAVKLDADITALDKKTMRQNAEMLGQNVNAVQTALAKSVVDLDDLQFTNDSIVNAVADMKRIHQEMRDRIVQEAPQIEAMSKRLADLQTKP